MASHTDSIKGKRIDAFKVDPDLCIIPGYDTDDGPEHPLYDRRVEKLKRMGRAAVAHMIDSILLNKQISDVSLRRNGDVLETGPGKHRVLVTKPGIAGFGLNWQHCAHQTFFPSHSFEQCYQAIRRCWRFGQKNAVRVDVISSEGEAGVLANLNRKAVQADQMFGKMVELINQELRIEKTNLHTQQQEIPSWL